MPAFRPATEADLPAIVRLLADDELGAARERYAEPLPDEYRRAFAAIARQEGNQVIVAVEDGVVVGCLQLTLIPGLSRLGVTRAQIESVRVADSHRGKGLGESLVRHAIDRARECGCGLVQLATDKSRLDARRFYERLGFTASHEGMKLVLSR
ncbi:MAG: GNAT family N-acetyltransferase [Alphaproteobacteria bacterium]|nr:GNAT family N-acetyltransferase [Alphaproteobacteria bacterium]